VVDHLGSGLKAAGFWNYLREDITYSLFQQCPLKIDLDQLEMPLPSEQTTDHGYLNAVSLILGRIINACFSGGIASWKWDGLFDMLRGWSSTLPARFRPFSRQERGLGLCLPCIRMLQDCHVAALHYQLVCIAILCTKATPENMARMKTLTLIKNHMEEFGESKEEMTERCGLDICGIAFTTNSPPVLVNAFGPMAFCE
jgi:hypothetical protein